MSPALTITLLGRFGVTVGGRVIADRAWGSRKAQHLVKLLALAPQRRLTTEQILDALWPELDPQRAVAAFHQTCYLARRALDRAALLTVRAGMVALAPTGDCLVDCVAFEQAAATARRTRARDDYATALARYAGPLLPEDRYADWAVAAAERLRALALALRQELASLHEAAGDEAAAEAQWQQLLADEPADESAHVGLMRLHARRGERQRAVRQYHLLHARLRDDLDVAPDPATRRLYAAILGGQYPPVAAAAPAAPAALPPHALPVTLTSLIGREAEIAVVGALLGGPARLVTLTGAGGCGKTRLALATAEALLPTFPGGVWWIGLAALADEGLVAATAAQVVGALPAPGQTAREALIGALRERAALLVLDNTEHLRAACAELALAILRDCPAVRVLATSRAALRALGEQTWRVPSLPVPAPPDEGVVALAALAENDAARLFAARARLVRADFALTAANGAAVAAICRRLEGLPLAIELAAARVGLLDPRQLAARLGDALGLLTGGARGMPDRQRTLRATLDWSYDLLDPAEQALFARLAVFAGGWTLGAAEAVGGDAGGDVLAGLAGLIEHSLVQVEAADEAEEPRYRLLEPARQYALARLIAEGDEPGARAAHAAFFLALAEEAATRAMGPTLKETLRLLRGEVDNLRAALDWLAASGDRAGALRLATALGPFWRQQPFLREGWARLEALLPDGAGRVAPAVEAGALLALTTLAQLLGNHDAALADRHGAARTAHQIGSLHRNAGNAAAAAVSWRAAVDDYAAVGDRLGRVSCVLNTVILAYDRGDVAAAREQLTAALPEVRALGDARVLAISLVNLATYTLGGPDATGVRAILAEAVALAAGVGEGEVALIALNELATLAALEGRPARAARLLGAAAAGHERSGQPVMISVRPFIARAEAAARAALGEAAFLAAWAAGAILTTDEALAEGLADGGALAGAPPAP